MASRGIEQLLQSQCPSIRLPVLLPHRSGPRSPAEKLQFRLGPLVLLALWSLPSAVEAVYPRSVPTVGEVLAVQGDDNTISLIELPQERRNVEAKQFLATGDRLRTGPVGRLALLFDDHTQVRVHRNTDIEIRYIASSPGKEKTSFKLNYGGIWARFGGAIHQQGVRIEMPAATAEITGTDWYAAVDGRQVTALAVMAGTVRLYNELGEVLVEAGESAIAEPGKAPVKRKTIRLADQPFMYLDLTTGWTDFLPVSAGGSPDAGDDPVLRAGRLYDAGRFEEAVRVLSPEAAQDGEAPKNPDAKLIAGLIAVRERRFQEAEQLLASAAAGGAGRQHRLAELGRFAVAVETEQLTDAEHRLAQLELAPDQTIEIGLARSWFEMLGGNYTAASRKLESLKLRFPNEARIWILEAQLRTLEGDANGVAAATEHALALAPKDYLAWYWRGVYLFKLNPNSKAALDAYDHVIALRPSYGPAWNDRALLLTELGRDREAQQSADRAVSLDPNRALFHATAGMILNVAARRRESDAAFQRALSLETNQPDALRGKGVLRLQESDNAAAIELLRKAGTVDPENNDGNLLLGTAEYQQGAVTDARKTLANAARIDPNDPLPYLMLSVIAQDHAMADAAIVDGREAIKRIERTGPIRAEGLASAQSGILNIGSAYANLGLDDWGGYYGQLGFSPYSANSQFFLSNTYRSARAHDSLNLQGLMLDPTAVSNNLRDTQFIRKPGTEVSFAGDANKTEDGDGWGSRVEVHGFARLPTPLAYRFWADKAQDNGFRANSFVDTQRLGGAVGGWLDNANYLFGRAQYSKNNIGLPGAEANPNLDQHQTNEFSSADIGFQHRFNSKNRVLGRIEWRSLKQYLVNPKATNLGLSDLDYSLINTFGLTGTRQLYSLGLYDAWDLFRVPGRVPLIAGPAGQLFGQFFNVPLLTDRIAGNIDLNPIAASEAKSDLWTLQLRHLFEAGDWDWTYGIEAGVLEDRLTTELRSLSQSALGLVFFTDPVSGLLADSEPRRFPYGSPDVTKISSTTRQHAELAYVDGTWRVRPDLSVQIGAYVRHLDDGVSAERTQFDPRLGLAWRPSAGQWLRLAAQRELILPLSNTLAPVTLAGVVPTDDYARLPAQIPSGASHYATGTSTEDFTVRWDAEWSNHLFTFFSGEQQKIRGYIQGIPWTGDLGGDVGSTIQLDSVRVRQLLAGVNLWIRGGVGVYARYAHNWSRILGSGAEAGKHVPLVPTNTLDLGVSYVHPSQVRFGAGVRYLGKRWADTGNNIRLDGTWLTDLSVNWQPMQRHWSLTAAVVDAFNSKPEVAAEIRVPGRTYLLSAEYRF